MEWRDIATAPKDDTILLGWIPETDEARAHPRVIFYGKHNHVPIYGWLYHADTIGGEEVEPCNPSHWMPIPEPPE